MDYEEFYLQAQVLGKGLGEKLKGLQKACKSVMKNSETGDLKSLRKNLEQMRVLSEEQTALSAEYLEFAEGFDGQAYMTDGDFARQMLKYCEQFSVDVKGDFPTYEMFPYKIKIDAENQEITVNRRKVQCLRPLSFVKDMKQNREKYLKASFNVNSFLGELADAYDKAIIIKRNDTHTISAESDLFIKDLYELLAPTQRARKDYDLQNYASDLAKLYAAAAEIEYKNPKDGRRFEFGTTKKAAKLIRILDQNGNEEYLGTIRFFR